MKLRLLSDADSREIYAAAIRILREMGMRVMDGDTRRLLQKAGCREADTGHLLFDEQLVQKATSSVPKRMVLFDRDGEAAVDSADTVPYFAPGLNCINVLDPSSGVHRLCTIRDIRETARLCDRLSNIDMAAGLGNPSDLPPSEQAMATVKALAEGTRKPLAFIAHDEKEDEEIWGYLADLAGGWHKLSDKPFALDLTGPYSPLELGEEACRRLRFCARHRLPVVCYPALITGAAGPVTLAGAIAQSSAEILAGIVVHQLEQPGAPVISGSAVLPMDLMTGGIAYGSPEYGLACLGAVDFFGDLNIPTWFGAGCSDSHTVDAQAAAEAGMNLQTAVLSGTSFIHNLGYLSAGKTGSLEMLVLCDEIAGALKSFVRGIAVNEETLAVEVIRRGYREHSFMMDEHTLRHMRTALWQPVIFQRTTREQWSETGSALALDRIRERLRELLER
ncbi:MAG: trimethylamine methyltransferase family protein [Spirochaetaceae bacterium]|nr:MAG: trimethylamine methyltransferase family protein [Spirochaetaceae bacterium]